MNSKGTGILGTGHYLSQHIQTNEELCEIVEGLTPDWIIAKTGIKRRFHVSKDETATSMALNASKRAIENAGIDTKEIGLVVVASFSQDYLFPPLSAKIHSLLGLSKACQVFDINTNCVGLVTAMTLAAERLRSDPSIRFALVIGVEVLSKFTDAKDKDTSIFFSDGAAAVILGEVKEGSGYSSAKFLTDSSTFESVRMRAGGSSFPANAKTEDAKAFFIEQNGLATWKQAVTNLPVVINKLLENENKKIEEIDFFIFHQANGFLIDYVLKKLKIPLTKTYTNVEEIGNTGSASIGIALSEAFEKGLIKSGDNLILAGVGAGFNFGACLFKMQ
ncbi:MAG: ketoacyl-ACP synthase III [Ferruginibacter sp.]